MSEQPPATSSSVGLLVMMAIGIGIGIAASQVVTGATGSRIIGILAGAVVAAAIGGIIVLIFGKRS